MKEQREKQNEMQRKSGARRVIVKLSVRFTTVKIKHDGFSRRRMCQIKKLSPRDDGFQMIHRSV
jgi:hypothetical protein